jgi:heat shock protein HtpX
MTRADRRAGIQRRQKLRNVTQGILLLATLVGITVLLVWWLLGPEVLPWVLGAGLLVGVLRPGVPARLALRTYGALPIPRPLAPQLHHIVGVLAERAGLAQVPSIYMVPRPEPNAFAVGYGREPVLGRHRWPAGAAGDP